MKVEITDTLYIAGKLFPTGHTKLNQHRTNVDSAS